MDTPDYVRTSKETDEILLAEADFTFAATRVRRPNTAYSQGTRVVPSSPTGFQYQATTAGTTGAREPRWPTTAAQTVNDGSVVWTCEAVSSQSLERTLSSATWSAEGVTVGSPETSGQIAHALVSGGVAGQLGRVRCVGTFSDGTVKTVRIDVELV